MSHEKTPEEIVAERASRELRQFLEDPNRAYKANFSQHNQSVYNNVRRIQDAQALAFRRLSVDDPNYDRAGVIKILETEERPGTTKTWWGKQRSITRDLVAWSLMYNTGLGRARAHLFLGRDGELYESRPELSLTVTFPDECPDSHRYYFGLVCVPMNLDDYTRGLHAEYVTDDVVSCLRDLYRF